MIAYDNFNGFEIKLNIHMNNQGAVFKAKTKLVRK